MKNPVVQMLAMFLIMGEGFNGIFAEPAPEIVPVEAKDEEDDEYVYDEDCKCAQCLAIRYPAKKEESVEDATDKPCDCSICRKAKAVREAKDENLCVRCGCDTEFDDGDYLNGDFICYECMTANEYRDI